MKLIIAIVHDEDRPKVTAELSKQGFSATELCSSGGFLKSGNTTLLIGVDDDKVDRVIEIIMMKSESREYGVKTPKASDKSGRLFIPNAVEVVVSGATIFVADVDRFEKF